MSFASTPSSAPEGLDQLAPTRGSDESAYNTAVEVQLQQLMTEDELIAPMFVETGVLTPSGLRDIWRDPALVQKLNEYAELPERQAKIDFVQTHPDFFQAINETKTLVEQTHYQQLATRANDIVRDFWPDFALEHDLNVPDEYNERMEEFLQSLVVNGYDLMNLSPQQTEDLSVIIQVRVNDWQEEETEAEAEETEAEAEETEAEAIDSLDQRFNSGLLTGVDIDRFEAEGLMDQFSETLRNRVLAYRAKLEALSDLGANEAESARLAQISNAATVDVNQSDPRLAFADVFSRVDAAVASGEISQDTADEVYLSITGESRNTEPLEVPNNPQEFSNLLSEQSTAVTRDANGQIIETRRITEPIEFRNGESRFTITPLEEPGQYRIHIPLRSQLPREFTVDEDWLAEGLTKFNPYLALQAMSNAGFTDMFGSEFTEDRSIEANYYRFTEASHVKTGDGSMWTSNETNRVTWIMQMLHPRGDWGQGDVNKDNWKEYAADKGLYNLEVDNWDFDALRLWKAAGIFGVDGKDGEALDRSGRNPTLDAPAEAGEQGV